MPERLVSFEGSFPVFQTAPISLGPHMVFPPDVQGKRERFLVSLRLLLRTPVLSDTGPTLTLLSSLLLKALSLNTVTLRASTEGLGRGYDSGLNKWYELRLK